MKKTLLLTVLLSLVFIPATLFAGPTVFPTGVTIYKPEKCFNGYNINATKAELLDMNGNVVHQWKGLTASNPFKILPGGYIMGSVEMGPGFDRHPLLQLDWDGKIVWKFDRSDMVAYPGKAPEWRTRQHHDYQRQGNPVGYYAPGMNPFVDKGNTLINTFKNVKRPDIAPVEICANRIIEVTWEGKIVWEWLLTDHWDEFGLDECAKNAFYRYPGFDKVAGCTQKVFFNNIDWLGPNKWYDAGDERFHPDNIIANSPLLTVIVIISKKTGKIVWRVGPDFTKDPAQMKLGQMMYLHNAHLIPRGLPGEGNILVHDNGGQSGIGCPNPFSPTGIFTVARGWSRIVEFNPITLEIVWGYSASRNPEDGVRMPWTEDFGSYKMSTDSQFFSHNISNVQRLPNGNTLITEGSHGRVFEVTPKHEIVWEWMNPTGATVYRSYRVPYEWIPQLRKPAERAVIPPEKSKFRIKPEGDTGVHYY